MSTSTLYFLLGCMIATLFGFGVTACVQNQKHKDKTYSELCAEIGGQVVETQSLGPKAMIITNRKCVLTK